MGIKSEAQVAGWADLLKDYLAVALPRRACRAVAADGRSGRLQPLAFQPDRGRWLQLFGPRQPADGRVLEESRRTVDRNRRKDLYGEFQELWAQEEPSIILYHPEFNWAVGNGVKDIQLTTFLDGSSRFRNLAEWYVRTKLVPQTKDGAAQ